ncbi:hypothetical protein HK096_008349 [Nowakowskiella sp. JEL0078]|nr:hypothetical protein HK096_008349 [Nowakowskiella sp. JEL0078]
MPAKSLQEIASKALAQNIHGKSSLGDLKLVPYGLVKPALQRCSERQLTTIEYLNPYILDDSDELWRPFVLKLALSLGLKPEKTQWREQHLKLKLYETDRIKNIRAKVKEKRSVITEEKKPQIVRIERAAPQRSPQKPFRSTILNKIHKELRSKKRWK